MSKMKNLEKITKKEAEKLVKEHKATFISYGFDEKYILVKGNSYYKKNIFKTFYKRLK